MPEPPPLAPAAPRQRARCPARLRADGSRSPDYPPMRIEVSVPGIRNDRGKLPAPTTLGPLTLARSPAAEPPIRDKLIDAAREELVIGAEVREPVASAHPVRPKTKKRMINRITTWLNIILYYPCEGTNDIAQKRGTYQQWLPSAVLS